jgi:hypothetical protein
MREGMMDKGNFVIFCYVYLFSVAAAYVAGWYKIPFSLRIERR